MRILAIDYGTVRIGVAVSDALGLTAQPVAVIKGKDQDAALKEIARLVENYQVTELLIGLPRNMNGSEGPMAVEARAFGQKLAERFKLPIVEWDERLSSQAAERVLLEADLSRSRRKQVVDKVAAAFILQGYLDSRPREKS